MRQLPPCLPPPRCIHCPRRRSQGRTGHLCTSSAWWQKSLHVWNVLFLWRCCESCRPSCLGIRFPQGPAGRRQARGRRNCLCAVSSSFSSVAFVCRACALFDRARASFFLPHWIVWFVVFVGGGRVYTCGGSRSPLIFGVSYNEAPCAAPPGDAKPFAATRAARCHRVLWARINESPLRRQTP